MRDHLIGIDVGGTFTDGVLIRPGAAPLVVKSLTDHGDPIAGLRACLDRMAAAAGIDRATLLRRTGKLAYGTTQAANLVVEGKAAKAGFITTRGFRDTLVIAGIGRERIGLDLRASRAPSLIPRDRIHEVRERTDAEGREVAPLHMDDVRAAIAALEAERVEAVGVCLLWSFRDPSHEHAVAQALREHDGWYVTISSEVAPLLGEYERSATTALNAILGPPLHRHLTGVERDLREQGLAVPLLIMRSSGGLVPAADAARTPVSLIASGPAGGVLASKLVADAMGEHNVICVDMGGTTFDVSLISDGEYAATDRARHAGQDLFVQAIDIHSIGAGGGSVGWIDHGTRLKVGPESAGSDPGPACYGRGGARATVTDADLVLGGIDPSGLAGGSLALDAGASRRALADLGRPLGMDADATAEGMVAIVDAAMSDAIRAQTVGRGLDPADFVLFAFGGAGPLHAVALARDLGIRRVVVPELATVLSAYGVVASDLLHVLAVTEARALDERAAIAATYARLEREGTVLLDVEEVPRDARSFRRWAEIRFRGQRHAVRIAVDGGEVDDAFVAKMRADFVREYERLYGVGTASPQAGMEAVTLRVDAIGRTPRPPLIGARAAARDARPAGTRRVRHEGRALDAAVFRGPLAAGSRLTGPALVDFPGNTVWVPPGTRAVVDEWRSVVVEVA